MSQAAHARYGELDLLRSLAVVGMVGYHAAYDLATYYAKNIPIYSLEWRLFAQAVAALFLVLVGISFAISWERHHPKHEEFWQAYHKYLRRGVGLLLCGVLVSVVTYIIDPGTYVRFGILHLIGTSILLLPFFPPLRERTGLIGVFLMLLSPLVGFFKPSTSIFLPLGFTPAAFSSVDYFPLLPWFGVVLIGYTLGHALYIRGLLKKHLILPEWIAQWLMFPGRNALWIYVMHQPVLMGILWVGMGK